MHRFNPVCGRCESSEYRIKRIERGVPYCEKCYAHMFPVVLCEKCYRTARIFKFDEIKICRKCRNSSLRCARCSQEINKASRRIGDAPICGSCANVFAREDSNSNSKCVDESVRSRYTEVIESGTPTKFITCKHCAKHRKPSQGYKENGLCVECYDGNRPYHDCPQCSSPVAGVGSSICLSCDRENKVQARIRLNVELLESTDFRERFLAASKGISNKSSSAQLVGRVDRLACAMSFLERHSQNAENVDQKLIIASIENEVSRSYSTLANILSKVFRVEWNVEIENDIQESRRIDEIISRNNDKPRAVLQEYLDYLLSNEAKKYKKKTIRVYLRCAEAFLVALCIDNSISECSPESVRNFQLRNPGLRSSLRVFFNFVESAYEIRYSSLSVRKTNDKKLDRLLREKCKSLVSRISQSNDLSERKALTARALSLLYGIPLITVVSQTVNDFVIDGGDVYWEVDNDEILIPEIISGYILESVASKKSRFVFWGDGNERPMSTASVNYWTSI